jgi:predicted Rossmann fold flavoprotein
MSWDVVIIGGGPAGLMAGIRAAERGRRTLLVEKNRRPGVKILLSGGTRCNLTHATDNRGIVAAFGPAGRFLHSALALLGPQQVLELFEAEGVATKVEEGGKVFPRSDRAADVLSALRARLTRSGCTLATEETLDDIQRGEGLFHLRTSRQTLSAHSVVLATGGRSYPACGTTGDGYRWAESLGHRVVPPRPALVPVTTHAAWVPELRGITVADALVKVIEPAGAACLAQQRGSLLFTHFGLSGPAVLDVSRVISGHAQPQALELVCDFLPGMKQEELEALLFRQCAASGKKHLAVILTPWLQRRLAEKLVELAALPSDRRVAELSKSDLRRVAATIKHARVPVAGTMGFRKAEVTAGGVSLDEVDSRTLQSKLVPNLYFAGELLDLDGPIGGYNFQAAFSTGWLAGESA